MNATLVSNDGWFPSSWRGHPARQMPEYADEGAVRAVEARLANASPVVGSEDSAKLYCSQFKGPVPALKAGHQYFILPDEQPSNQQVFVDAVSYAKVPFQSPYSYVVEEPFYQALGAASMCWSETPKGIFDSTRAKEIGDKLLELLGHPQTNPYAGVLLSPQQKDAMEEMKDAQGNKIFAPRDSLRFGEDL